MTMPRPPKLAGKLTALWLAFQAAACEPRVVDPPIGQPPAKTRVTSVDPLVATERARLYGKGLAGLKQLSVDGQSVPFTVVSDEIVEFTVPTMRACETDGRSVELVLDGTIKANGVASVHNTLRLEVGESRVLDANDLQCLQLSGRDEDYLLAVANFSREKVIDRPFQLRTYTAVRNETVEPLRADPASNQLPAQTASEVALGFASSAPIAPSPAFVSFDKAADQRRPFDDYAGASVGDTLRFVDWGDSRSHSARTEEEVPVYHGVVIALAGRHMIVVDTRLPNASEFLKPASQARFQTAAAIADQYTIPAVRAVIDPAFEPPSGAGGRIVTIIQNIRSFGGVRSADLNLQHPFASDMFTIFLSDRALSVPAGLIAQTIIHEVAHLTEVLLVRDGRSAQSIGWYSEALAEVVAEMAARMALGHETQAPASRFASPGVPISMLARSPSHGASIDSPWGPIGSSQGAVGPGAYDRGARILMFAQEKLGVYQFNPTAPTLFQRMAAKAPIDLNRPLSELLSYWGIEAIAHEVGMTPEELLEQSMLADLTDDLLPQSAVQRFHVPQIITWDHSVSGGADRYSKIARPEHILPRDVAREGVVGVPAGGYQYWYIPGQAGRGLSLRATDLDLKPHHKAIIVRLR